MKSAGPKMIVSTRGDAAAMASTSTRPLAFSICASMPIRPTSRPMRLLDLGQQQVQRVHLRRGLHLRQHHRVEVGAGALDDRDHVAVGPLRGPVVDPHHAGLARPVALVQRRDDVGARVDLGQRRHRVLEVEEHLVGGQALRLAEHLRVRARHRQAGPPRARRLDGRLRRAGRLASRRSGYRRVTRPGSTARRRRGRDEMTMPSPTSSSSAAGSAASGGVWPSATAAISAAPGHLEQQHQRHHGRAGRAQHQVEHRVPEQLRAERSARAAAARSVPP